MVVRRCWCKCRVRKELALRVLIVEVDEAEERYLKEDCMEGAMAEAEALRVPWTVIRSLPPHRLEEGLRCHIRETCYSNSIPREANNWLKW